MGEILWGDTASSLANFDKWETISSRVFRAFLCVREIFCDTCSSARRLVNPRRVAPITDSTESPRSLGAHSVRERRKTRTQKYAAKPRGKRAYKRVTWEGKYIPSRGSAGTSVRRNSFCSHWLQASKTCEAFRAESLRTKQKKSKDPFALNESL